MILLKCQHYPGTHTMPGFKLFWMTWEYHSHLIPDTVHAMSDELARANHEARGWWIAAGLAHANLWCSLNHTVLFFLYSTTSASRGWDQPKGRRWLNWILYLIRSIRPSRMKLTIFIKASSNGQKKNLNHCKTWPRLFYRLSSQISKIQTAPRSNAFWDLPQNHKWIVLPLTCDRLWSNPAH